MSGLVPTATLHLTNAWHPESGGVRTFYLGLLGEAERRQRHLTIVVPGERNGVEVQGRTTRIVTIAAPTVPILDRRYRAIWPHRFVFPFATAVWQVIDRYAPDVIEVCDKYALCHVAGLVKRRRGPRPTVVGLSQERMDDALEAHAMPAGVAKRVARAYLQHAYMRQFDAHVANSEYTAAELRDAALSAGPGRPLLWRLRDRIFVQPLGVDTVAFRPGERSEGLRQTLLAKSGRGEGARLAVFAGRLSAEKQAHLLVPTLERCVARGLDLVLVVVGDGPLAAMMADDAKRLAPARVIFLGHARNRQDLATILASADVFVHPNGREPFGIGPLEAMVAGTSVVVPASGGVLTYATPDNAWLAGPGAIGLAEAVEAWWHRPAEAEAKRLRAMADAERFTSASAADRYFRFYDEVHRRRSREWSPTAVGGHRLAVDGLIDIAHGEG